MLSFKPTFSLSSFTFIKRLFSSSLLSAIRVVPFAHDIILYMENPADVNRRLLELINEFGKVAGYKINTQKSLAFLFISNETSEREIKETIPLTITSKRIKYLGINLPKEEKDLYSENFKIQMKEIKGDTNR